MEVYAGLDLHSTNTYVAVIDKDNKVLYKQRHGNDLPTILSVLDPFKKDIQGVVVESTYNWYWLADALMDAGYRVHLANVSAIKQYEGLKQIDDKRSSLWLANLLRLNILPTGYIYPREQRAVRDLLRKRSQLVRQRSTQILSIGNLVARNLGTHAGGNEIKRWQREHVDAMPLLDEQKQALMANLAVMRCLDSQIDALERSILAKAKLREDYQALKTVSGIGEVLALTIALETGEVGRFDSPGHFASYARTVDSRRESNGKKKGEGNAKCGNKHLAWAFIEAAHFAVRYDAAIKCWYQKKCANGLAVVAIKAVAHKLARACWHVMKDGKPFEVSRAFG